MNSLTAQANCELNKEVEMEDLEEEDDEEQLPDIDANDLNNPLAVVDYVEEIYSFYKSNEVSILLHLVLPSGANWRHY